MIFPPTEPPPATAPRRRPTLRTQLLLGAAAAAALIAAVAHLLLRGPPPDPAPLRAALDAFTGEWVGEASIDPADGRPAVSLPVTRRYAWVADKQVVETRFVLGDQEFSARAIQWIEEGRLRALVARPDGSHRQFTGAPTADGILWTNQDQPQADTLDRILARDGGPRVQSASFGAVRLGEIDGDAWIAVALERPRESVPPVLAHTPSSTDVVPAPPADAPTRDSKTPAAPAQSVAKSATRAAAPARATAKEAPVSGATGRLEIKSSLPGGSFEIRASDRDGPRTQFVPVVGAAPAGSLDLPHGAFTVTLRAPGAEDQNHRVEVRAAMDVILFHRLAETAASNTAAGFSLAAPTDPVAIAPDTARTPRHDMIDSPPTPIIAVLPRFPSDPRLAGQRIDVSVLIDEAGQPQNPIVAGGVDPHLRRACLEALSQWQFEPARAGRQPVGVRVNFGFTTR